jgi:hypothetical protein
LRIFFQIFWPSVLNYFIYKPILKYDDFIKLCDKVPIVKLHSFVKFFAILIARFLNSKASKRFLNLEL